MNSHLSRLSLLPLLAALAALAACGGNEAIDPEESLGEAESPLSIVDKLDLGNYYATSLLSDGTVYTWGYNGNGQLGNGTTTNQNTPVQLTGLSNIVDVSGGWFHSCAVDSAGAVYCWGMNGYGKLGDGTTTQRNSPVAVTVLSGGAVGVSAGGETTCAVMSGGGVTCWGTGLHGELAMGGPPLPWPSTGVNSVGLSNVIEVDGGLAFTMCALHSTGTISCWGQNFVGQTGSGLTTDPQPTPTSVSGITNAVALSVGLNSVCAVLSGGTVQCWGHNLDGKLGTGSTTPSYSRTPLAVSGITDAVDVAVGAYHACALHVGGNVSCWGNNQYYALGDGTTTHRSSPVAASGISNAVGISAGPYATCVALAGGGAECWGYGALGGLGDGTAPAPTFVTSPVTVALP